VIRRRQPWLLVSWLWFLVALLPNLGLLQAGRQSIADRFTHLAMIGVSIGVGSCLGKLARASKPRKKMAAIGTASVLVVLAFLTARQIGFWHDSNGLFEHAISVEDSDYIRSNLATVLISQGRYAEARPHLEAAVRLSPQNFAYHNDLANVLLRIGRPAEAKAEAATALQLEPASVSAAETMGLILFRDGDSSGALTQFNRALELGAPPQPIASELSDMAASLASRGSPQGAEPLLRKALDLNPKLVQGWRNLALVLMDQHRAGEVTGVLHQAVTATGPQAAYADLMPNTPAR
jgi:protein O-mannosyl-transferase